MQRRVRIRQDVLRRLHEAHPELLPHEQLEAATREGSLDRAGMLLKELVSKKEYGAVEQVGCPGAEFGLDGT